MVLALVVPSSASAEELVGRASVVDADTLEIRGEKIRLHGIDAPEYEDEAYPELEEYRRDTWNTLGVIEADHIAEVGLELRLRRPNGFDHLAFFAGLAQFLDDAYPMKMKLRKDGHWERTSKSLTMESPVRAVV